MALLERELLNRETDLEDDAGPVAHLAGPGQLRHDHPHDPSTAGPPVVIPRHRNDRQRLGFGRRRRSVLRGQDITVDPDATVHFCLEIENIGEVPLTDLRIRSETLRIRSESPTPNVRTFVPVQGNLRADRAEPSPLRHPVGDRCGGTPSRSSPDSRARRPVRRHRYTGGSGRFRTRRCGRYFAGLRVRRRGRITHLHYGSPSRGQRTGLSRQIRRGCPWRPPAVRARPPPDRGPRVVVPPPVSPQPTTLSRGSESRLPD